MCVPGCTSQNNSTQLATIVSGCSSCPRAGHGGIAVYSDAVVEVRIEVTLRPQGVEPNSAPKPDGSAMSDSTGYIEIRVKCSKDAHAVQFGWREYIDPDGSRWKSEGFAEGIGQQKFTTDPNNPIWYVDSVGRPCPYYDVWDAPHCRCTNELILWDRPTVNAIYKGQTVIAHFSTFIICDKNVVREIRWTRGQKPDGKPSYSIDVVNASELPQWAKDTLKKDKFEMIPLN